MNWSFDGVGGKPMFLNDRRRMFPEINVQATMEGAFAGGILPFDFMWAFDDGGGNDLIPFSDSVDPVAVKFDTSYPADTYKRGKQL
jgi:hypothetical protein